MASFLPLVRELGDEYDPQAIAAAALQMIYDQSCPNWMKTDWEVPETDFNKPMLRRGGGGRGGRGNGGGGGGSKPSKPRRSSGGGRRPAFSDQQR